MVESPTFDPNDLQGNILRGYRSSLSHVRHLVLEVGDRRKARRFLAASAKGGEADVPQITRETSWGEKPHLCFNIGVTFAGLKALGTPADYLATFPSDFAEGMAARSAKLGDFGASAPENWPAPFDNSDRVHVIATAYASGHNEPAEAALDRVQTQLSAAFNLLGTRSGRAFPENKVHFGYVDSISQPRFYMKNGMPPEQEAGLTQPIDPLGTALLGYPTRLEGLMFRVPKAPLGLNGTFNAFRVLAQDVVGFEAYLSQAARELEAKLSVEDLDALLKGYDLLIIDHLLPPDRRPNDPAQIRFMALREIVAAQMCGRWRNGVPMANSPDWPNPKTSLTEFDYSTASRCPAGSHLRRVNPRGGPIVQRIANYTRRLIRRGMPYGPEYDPTRPDDGEERGLLGSFIGANIGAQFEAVMCDWLNLGLQDPAITRTNDPLIGANTPETSRFDFMLKDGKTHTLRGFPRFVTTRGDPGEQGR
jgi:deferrochelatase/peroxidase EfeB